MRVLGFHVLFTLTSFPKCSHWAQLPPILPSLQHVFSPNFTNKLQTHTSYSVISTATYRLLKFNMSKMEQMAFLLTLFSFAISVIVTDMTIHSDTHSRTWGCCTLYSFLSPLSLSPNSVNSTFEMYLLPLIGTVITVPHSQFILLLVTRIIW